MIKQKLEMIKSGELTSEANIMGFITKIRKDNPQINAVLRLNEKAVDEAKEIDKKIKKGKAGKLAGLGIIVKSNINVKGVICNCASKTLENYRGTYDASVISKLIAEDAIIIGMANMDEFACGASGESSAFGITRNPHAMDRIPGGSSSGSAASVAANFCDFALGSDTGGSIRNPASHCGVVGFKPSYGAVSRYGLIDLSMSLDQIGPLAYSVEDAEIIYDIIKGKDERDSTSREFVSENKNMKKILIGIPRINANSEIWGLIRKKIKEICDKNKWKYEDVELKHINLGIQTYYPINYVEFFSGTRKFDGRKYGLKIEEVCGEEVLRRILGGGEIAQAEFAGKYYRRALKAKKIIEEEFEKAFEKYDILIMPTVPKLPHRIGDKVTFYDMYTYDSLSVLANLAEIPAISVPVEKLYEIPVGIQIMAKRGNDNFLLEISKMFE
ncbi:MAG: amidase family protein [Candidatus Nanoarchaeia archaeon]|nr:amidase family protein [Candidatus Nanoarchaeia archaeon]MDD5741784.1 amidase family protein [Candidatus Nanoarchaeia archaeon]